MPWIRINTNKGPYYYTGRTAESAYAAFKRDNPDLEGNPQSIGSHLVPERYKRMAGETPKQEAPAPTGEEAQPAAEPEEEYSPPSEEDVLDNILDTAQELVNEFIEEQERAIEAVGGPFEELWNEEEAREMAIKKFSEYFEEEKDQIIEDVKEGRITTAEDYDFAIQSAMDNARARSKEIDIREAETQEELDDRLTDIGATTSFNLESARDTWKYRMRGEREEMGETGQIYGGRGTERIQDLQARRGAEMGEIARRGGVQEQDVERGAKYDMQRAAAARQEVEATKERELGRARTLAQRGIRQYGYDEGLLPGELRPEEEVPEYGRYGERQQRLLGQRKEEDILSEVSRMRAQKRKEYEQSLRAHGYSELSPTDYRTQVLSSLI